jgi:hypothetical protein
MTGQLITLPLRLSAQAASLMLRAGETVVVRALALAGRPMQTESPSTASASTESPPTAAPPTTRPTRRPRSAPPSRPRPAARARPPIHEPAAPPTEPESAQASEEPEPEPIHVSEEPELVAEIAEPGAEEGAGAQVTVDEPWDGYSKLRAKDVVARLSVASPAELAAVTLYESTHQARQTVLSAVERQLALAQRDPTSN